MTSTMKGKRRGFSLLEVMVSASLFILTVAGVTTSTRMLTDFQAHSRKMTMAIHVAEFTMEELLLRYNGDDDLKQSGNPHSREFDDQGEPAASGTGTYVAVWNVTPLAPVPKLVQIDVVVSWKERDATKTVSLLTYRPG